MTWDFQQCGMCDQQSLRSACSYAQSEQSLCLSLEYSMSVKLLNEHHMEFLRLRGGYTGSAEYTLVKMPHCWKSHVVARLSNHGHHRHSKDLCKANLLRIYLTWHLEIRSINQTHHRNNFVVSCLVIRISLHNHSELGILAKQEKNEPVHEISNNVALRHV